MFDNFEDFMIASVLNDEAEAIDRLPEWLAEYGNVVASDKFYDMCGRLPSHRELIDAGADL